MPWTWCSLPSCQGPLSHVLHHIDAMSSSASSVSFPLYPIREAPPNIHGGVSGTTIPSYRSIELIESLVLFSVLLLSLPLTSLHPFSHPASPGLFADNLGCDDARTHSGSTLACFSYSSSWAVLPPRALSVALSIASCFAARPSSSPSLSSGSLGMESLAIPRPFPRLWHKLPPSTPHVSLDCSFLPQSVSSPAIS